MTTRILTDLDRATADELADDYRRHQWTVIERQQANGLWRLTATK